MTFLPVVERELRTAAQRPVTRWSRLGVAAVAAGVVGFMLVFTYAVSAQSGGGVFRFVVGLLFVYASLTGVFLTADCLSVERREGTLGLLFLTDLRSYDVVLGKLAGRALTAFYGWMAVLPVLAISMLMGGVTGGEFWRIVLAVVSALALSLTAGLAVSAVVQGEHRARGSTFLVLLALNAGVPMVNQIVLTLGGSSWLPPALSPAVCCLEAFDVNYRGHPGVFWTGIALMQGLSWAALLFACWMLPRRWRDEGRACPGPSGRVLAWWSQGRGAGHREAKRPLEDDNPIAWLSARTVLMSRRSLWMVLLVALLLLIALELIKVTPSRAFRGYGIGGGLGLGLCLQVLVVFQAGRFFAESRRTGAMELLLSSPLSPREVVDGQVAALQRLFRGPALVVMLLHFWPVLLEVAMTVPSSGGRGVVTADVGLTVGMGVYGAMVLVADLYAAAWLSLLMSLGGRRPTRATLLTLLYVVVLPSLAFCVPRLLIDLPIIFAAKDRLRREFLLLARRPYDRTARAWRSGPLVPAPLGPPSPRGG